MFRNSIPVVLPGVSVLLAATASEGKGGSIALTGAFRDFLGDSSPGPDRILSDCLSGAACPYVDGVNGVACLQSWVDRQAEYRGKYHMPFKIAAQRKL